MILKGRKRGGGSGVEGVSRRRRRRGVEDEGVGVVVVGGVRSGVRLRGSSGEVRDVGGGGGG